MLSRYLRLVVFLSLCTTQQVFAQKFEELGKTPQMGWNSWNKFACNINEKLIRETADAMQTLGMQAVGYEYINIDDCWHGERDAQGNIRANAERFPSGMKALADYVHAKGLKLGLYSDVGATTCGGHPGSRGHEYQDAITYAAWGIDYLKYDWCDSKDLSPVAAYTTMRDAIKKAGRPILFSMCEWGDNKPWDWAKDIAHSWRTTADIYPCWDCELSHGSYSTIGVMRILDKQVSLRKFAGPGHWNDMDMLEVGNGLTPDEERAHFSLWAILASPLISGNDLRSMSEQVRSILTNKEVIAINQDKLGIQAWKMFAEGDVEIWMKPLANNEWAMLILNRGAQSLSYEYDWLKHQVSDDLSKREIDFHQSSYNWTELWTKASGDTKQNFKAKLLPHSVALLKLKPR